MILSIFESVNSCRISYFIKGKSSWPNGLIIHVLETNAADVHAIDVFFIKDIVESVLLEDETDDKGAKDGKKTNRTSREKVSFSLFDHQF